MSFCHFELPHLPATCIQETMDREIISPSLWKKIQEQWQHDDLFGPQDELDVQWNPSITDTIGNQNFVRYREVSPAKGFR